ncbi:MAG: SHOCT domain-containing protein [Gaiellaceae bacterium]
MTSHAEPSAPSISRKRAWGVRGLVVLGCLLLLVSVIAVWVDRLLLEPDTLADTSEEVLEQPEVQAALGAFMTDRLYASVDVQAELENVLPPNLDPLAGPAAAGLREYVQRATTELLGRPRVIAAWRTAVEQAGTVFVLLVEDEGEAVRTTGGVVTLDLGVVLDGVVERTGLGERVASRLPEGAGTIVILQSDELSTLQTLIDLLQILASWLWVVALALFALALYLGRDARRRTLRSIAFGWVLIGIALLAIIRIGVPRIADSLASAPIYADAGRVALETFLASLKDAARTLTGVGLLALLGVWVAGPGSHAVALRRWSAPVMRERPELVWGAYGLLVLLLLAWGPTGATRRLLTVVILICLSALGLWFLQRLVVREHPDATLGEGWSLTGSAGAAVGRLRGRGAPAADEADAGLARLERLNTLRADGALTEEEFTAEKAKILQPAPGP